MRGWVYGWMDGGYSECLGGWVRGLSDGDVWYYRGCTCGLSGACGCIVMGRSDKHVVLMGKHSH